MKIYCDLVIFLKSLRRKRTNFKNDFLVGGRRFSEGTSADREIQRTLMELLNQMDGFDSLGQVLRILFSNLFLIFHFLRSK